MCLSVRIGEWHWAVRAQPVCAGLRGCGHQDAPSFGLIEVPDEWTDLHDFTEAGGVEPNDRSICGLVGLTKAIGKALGRRTHAPMCPASRSREEKWKAARQQQPEADQEGHLRVCHARAS